MAAAEVPGPAGPPDATTQALVLYAIKLHGAGFNLGLVLFGVHLVLIGGLIVRSGYLPRLIGAGVLIAGVCYVLNSVATFTSPHLADSLFPWILLPGFLAEGALTLWLLIVGVSDAGRRRRLAEA